jgi:hypothetical protein
MVWKQPMEPSPCLYISISLYLLDLLVCLYLSLAGLQIFSPENIRNPSRLQASVCYSSNFYIGNMRFLSAAGINPVNALLPRLY